MRIVDLASGLGNVLFFVVEHLLDALDALLVVVNLSVHHLDLLLLHVQVFVRVHLHIANVQQRVAVVVL